VSQTRPQEPTTDDRVRSTLATTDWRRMTFDLYRRVRATPDPQTAHALWRETRDAMFAEHPASPLLDEDARDFESLPVPDYDPAWRFQVRIEATEPAEFDFETGTDGVVHFDRLGLVRVPGVGTLDVWKHGGYAGGRYLLDTIKGSDLGGDDLGSLVLDFNFAYNPSCAYDPAWACPLAPPGNTVPVPIPVGEQYDF
jgi:uncharacterized protein (DUF1684 family)